MVLKLKLFRSRRNLGTNENDDRLRKTSSKSVSSSNQKRKLIDKNGKTAEDEDVEEMQLDWVKKAGKKATPLFVHLLMIISVGAYAIFGALVMRSLESKSTVEVEKISSDIQRRSLPNSHFSADNKIIQLSQKHRRRRRHNETDDEIFNKFAKDFSPRQTRAAAHVMRSRRCVIGILKKMSSRECSLEQLDDKLVKELDECYHVAIEHNTHVNHVLFKNSQEQVESIGEENEEEIEPWSFMDSLLFAFTVITTIGYGNVAPRTFGGRFFVIIYGLIGIPFTLLAIADLGKFISEVMITATNFVRKTIKKLKKAWQSNSKYLIRYPKSPKFVNGNCKPILEKDIEEEILESGKNELDNDEDDERSQTSNEDDDELTETQAFSLFILFLLYIAAGGLMLSSYEPDLDFFKAVYFNFVTLTSIGLGDIVPQSETYMFLTIIYIAIGLALTTIAIEIAADALKKLHYFGRKIENVGNVAIWFGGKKITMKALVKNLGDQFNLPTTVVKNLNLDNFVEQAIMVEEGELETLRPPPFEPDPDECEDVGFADEPENEWISDPTPSPPPSPQPIYRLPSPEPEIESSVGSPVLRTPSPFEEEVSIPSPEPTPPREPTPPPKPPTPPKEPTPEPEPEPEPEPPREPTPPPPPPPSKPRPLTAAEIAAQKRKAYSEEAWRRYQEYQKQWKKFRQTQKVPSTSGTSTSKPKGSSPDGGGNATGTSTRSQSIASVTSGKTSRSATPDNKKSHPVSTKKGDH